MSINSDSFGHIEQDENRFFSSVAEHYPRKVMVDGSIPSRSYERPYHSESTASRQLSEVKPDRAWLVLRWVTTLESRVLFVFFAFFILPLCIPCMLLSTAASRARASRKAPREERHARGRALHRAVVGVEDHAAPRAERTQNKQQQKTGSQRAKKRMRITRIERVTYRWTVRSSVWRSPN